eukprot:SAG22_NODE_2114_length_2991_cov_1.459889_2_plen_151_part_00
MHLQHRKTIKKKRPIAVALTSASWAFNTTVASPSVNDFLSSSVSPPFRATKNSSNKILPLPSASAALNIFSTAAAVVSGSIFSTICRSSSSPIPSPSASSLAYISCSVLVWCLLSWPMLLRARALSNTKTAATTLNNKATTVMFASSDGR